MVILEGKTLREVSQFVSDKLSPLDSILSTKTNFILKKYKDHAPTPREIASCISLTISKNFRMPEGSISVITFDSGFLMV